MTSKLVPLLVLVCVASAAAGFVGGRATVPEANAAAAATEAVRPGPARRPTTPLTVVTTPSVASVQASEPGPDGPDGSLPDSLPDSLLEPVSARTAPAVARAIATVPSLDADAAERWSRTLLDADPAPPAEASARLLALVLALLRWAELDPDAAVAAAFESLPADPSGMGGSSFDFELVNEQGCFGGRALADGGLATFDPPCGRPGGAPGSQPMDALVRAYPDGAVRWLDARDASQLSFAQRAFVADMLRSDGPVSADVAWGLVERAGATPAIDDWAVELAHAVRERDPELARRWVQARFAGSSADGPVAERVWRLMPFDPAGALALIESVPDPDERSRLLADHAASLAADDPGAALALASSLDGADRSRALDAVVGALSVQPPERAVDVLRELAVEDVRALQPGSLEGLVDSVARERPDAMPGLVAALGDAVDGTRASEVYRSWSRADPVAADAWASANLPPDRFETLAADAAIERAGGDPDATLAAFAALPSSERARLATRVATTLGSVDPDAAGRWRDALADPAERVAANAGLWAIATMQRPDLALDVLATLDPSERLATFERAVPLFGRMNPGWLAAIADDDRLAPAERAAAERWTDACLRDPF